MKNLLYKEFRLAKHPTMFFFPLFASMLLIPAYPYEVAFFYTCLEIFFIFQYGRETKDVFFTVLLPVKKRDVVKARCWMMVCIELFQLIVSIPFALLNARLYASTGGNMAGMDANVAFFGFMLVMYGLFNLLYLSVFYKDAYRAGRAFFAGCAGILLYIGLVELAVQAVPPLKAALDTLAPAAQLRQIPVLLGGAALFALLTLLGYKRAAARFENVDL